MLGSTQVHQFSWALATLLVATGITLADTPEALADGTKLANEVTGEWTSMRSRKEVREKIDKRVETFLDELPFYKVPFARPRLKTATEPCWTVAFKRPDSGTISIRCNQDNPVVTPDDGTEREWTSKDGDTYTVTQTVHDDKIVQVFESDSGTRTNTYKFDGSRMKLDIRLASPNLPLDLTYTRFFERPGQ